MKNLNIIMGRIRCVQKCVQKHEFVCKNKNETVEISTVSWRRARDSNPTFAMAGTVENTGIQRLVKMSVFKSVFKKSPAGLCVLFIQNA